MRRSPAMSGTTHPHEGVPTDMTHTRTAARVVRAATVAVLAGGLVAAGVVSAHAESAGTLSILPTSGAANGSSTFTTSGQCPGAETVRFKVFGGSGDGAVIADPATINSPKNINGAILASSLNSGSGMQTLAGSTWQDFATGGSPSLSRLNGVYTVRAWCSGGSWFDGKITFSGTGVSDAIYVAGEVTAPGAPVPVATPGSGQVSLSWPAPADGGSAITGYTVTRTPGSVTCPVVGLTALCTGLTNGTTYTFAVVAHNALFSSPEGTTTGKPAGKPGKPGSPVATRVKSGVNYVGNKLKVSWTAAAANGAAVTGYTVTASPKVGTATKKCTTTGALTCTVLGLTNGVGYTFSVTATNSAGTGLAATTAKVSPIGTIPITWVKTGLTLKGTFAKQATATKYKFTATGATKKVGFCAVATKVTCTIPLVRGTTTVVVTALNAAGAQVATATKKQVA